MFRGKSYKGPIVAGLLAAIILLQGCSSPEGTPEPEPTEIQEAVAENKYNPRLSSTFDEPWPTNVTRLELAETALFKSFKFLDEAALNACPVKTNVFINPDMLPGHIELIKSLSARITLVFCDYLNSDMTLVAGDYIFLKETVAVESLPSDEFGGICGYELIPRNFATTGCAYSGVAWVGVPFGTQRRGELISDRNAVAMVPHELFHIVQDTVDPGQAGISNESGQDLYRPVWWIEGGGEFLGRLLPRYFEVQDYGFAPLSTDNYGSLPPLEPYSDLKAFESWNSESFGSNGHYYAGQLALEYIAASAGLDSIMAILERLGQGATFDSAFESELGISVEDFYERFRVLHDNLIAKNLG